MSKSASERIGPARWSALPAGIALVCLVWAVFYPIADFGFVRMDVQRQVFENPRIQGLTAENIRHIFTSRSSLSYYPVLVFSFAIDHELWGLDAGGFKRTNVLIHLANVLLAYWLVLRLFRRADAPKRSVRPWWDTWAAALSAALVGVHPVVVEPVTWVSGREELLVMLGALGCLHLHILARRLAEEGGKTALAVLSHVSVAVCCLAACLSGAVAAVIPMLITAWDVLMMRRPKLRKIISGTFLLWMIAVATLLLKSGEVALSNAGSELGWAEWLMLILNLYWLNLKTLVWPAELAIFYEWPFPNSFWNAEVLLGASAVGLTCGALWVLRRQKLVLFGLLWFCLALGPTSQVLPYHIARADRFLYLPLAGLALALALGLRPLGVALQRRAAVAGVVAAAVLGLLLLAALSAVQVRTWRDNLSVWKRAVKVAPAHCIVHHYLANALARNGQLRQAFSHYKVSLSINSDRVQTLNDYASKLASCEDETLRNYEGAIFLAEHGYQLSEGKHPKMVRTLAMAYSNFAASLSREGQFHQAIENYDKAMGVDPQYDVPLFNLALLLATCSDRELRDPERAVRLAERGCELIGDSDPDRLSILAEAYAETGRLEEAIALMGRLLELAQAAGQVARADDYAARLKEYESRARGGDQPGADGGD